MQNVLVYIIFGVALIFVARKVYHSLHHKEGGGCPNCDPSSAKGHHKKAVHGK